jgi:hypothetical protein
MSLPSKRVGIEDAVAVLRALARDNWPGDAPAAFQLVLRSGAVIAFPFPTAGEGPCTHSPDFSEIDWFGEKQYFAPTQAAIVKVLWTAWESGCPEVGQQHLLEEAGSRGSRVRDLFKVHPAWGNMILLTERGTVCLRKPPDACEAGAGLPPAETQATPAATPASAPR